MNILKKLQKVLLRYLKLICFEVGLIVALIMSLSYIPEKVYTAFYRLSVITWLVVPFLSAVIAIVCEILDWKRENLEIYIRTARIFIFVVFVFVQFLLVFLLSQQ